MIGRGSLPHCIQAALHAFFVQHYPMLAILHNRTGCYYSVCTEEDLARLGEATSSSTHRLVWRGTRRELMAFCKQPQPDLFTEDQTHAYPDTHETP